MFFIFSILFLKDDKFDYFQAVASKEDSPKGIVRQSEDVERQRRAHLNDLENIPVFLIVAFFYTLTSPTAVIAVNLIRAFAISRITHTFVYAVIPMQPARAISFFVGFGITIYMSINVALFFYQNFFVMFVLIKINFYTHVCRV